LWRVSNGNADLFQPRHNARGQPFMTYSGGHFELEIESIVGRVVMDVAL
jgi:hypothetical protein